jgi:hypothetical protein
METSGTELYWLSGMAILTISIIASLDGDQRACKLEGFVRNAALSAHGSQGAVFPTLVDAAYVRSGITILQVLPGPARCGKSVTKSRGRVSFVLWNLRAIGGERAAGLLASRHGELYEGIALQRCSYITTHDVSAQVPYQHQ